MKKDLELLRKVEKENVSIMIPSGWDIYEWCKEHSNTSIAHSLKRCEKVMDGTDSLSFSWSGGKDSSVAANIACMELNLRKLRVKYGIDRNGNKRIDPLDAKWADKKLNAMQTDAEIVFQFTNDYSKRFLKRVGPKSTFEFNGIEYNALDVIQLKDGSKDSAENIYNRIVNGEQIHGFSKENSKQTGGLDLVEFNWFSLPLCWQSGVSFDSGYLISWDKTKEPIWVQPMPTKEDLHGFDPITEDSLTIANPVPLRGLSQESQAFHRENNNVIIVKAKDLFGYGCNESYKKKYEGLQPEDNVEAVANFGRGPINIFTLGMHEKDFSHDYSNWIFKTAPLVTDDTFGREELAEAFAKYHDTSKDVWYMTGDENGIVTSALVSLRAEESLDRRVILRQGEYSTGQYSNAGGTNNISLVFDYKTDTIWQVVSNTDWDINEVYERLFEAGVAPADQRVGSLLNYAAVRSIGTVKALEPELYSRINGRFNNVEFLASFSNRGYYNISKPKDTDWDGKNHTRAGMSEEEAMQLSDKYEEVLKKLEIPYVRNGVDFESADPEYKNKAWFPLKEWLKQHSNAS